MRHHFAFIKTKDYFQSSETFKTLNFKKANENERELLSYISKEDLELCLIL